MAEAKPTLQPLRIPAGWTIDVNELYEPDFSAEPVNGGYGSILFNALHRERGHELYVRRGPQGDPAGSVLLQRYLLKFEPQGSGVLAGYLVDELRLREGAPLIERLETHMRLPSWT